MTYRKRTTSEAPTGLLPEDLEELGITSTGTEPNSKTKLRSVLDAAVPGTITDDDIEAIVEFLQNKMNAAEYALIFACNLKSCSKGHGIMQLLGGDIHTVCMMMDLVQLSHIKRLQSKLLGITDNDKDS